MFADIEGYISLIQKDKKMLTTFRLHNQQIQQYFFTDYYVRANRLKSSEIANFIWTKWK